MTKDMTKGNPTKLIILFSIPMLLGNIFQQFYSMVDAMVVGKYVGPTALAAVGATGSFLFTIIGFAMGLTAGFSILVSHKFGAGDIDGVRKVMAMSNILSLGISVIVMIFGVLTTKPVLKLMNTPSDIMDNSVSYLQVAFLGVVATIFYNLISAVLRAVGDSKTPLYFLIIASILNIVLDLVFVLSLNMGVSGVAYATVIAQGISYVLCLIYMHFKHPSLRIRKEDWKIDVEMIKELIRIGLPTAFQNSVTGLGILILQVIINGFGSTVVAAYTAASRVQQLCHQPMFSLGLGLTTYVAQNLGAREFGRIKDGVKKSIIIVCTTAVLGMAIIFFAGPALTGLFISGDKAVEMAKYAREYLLISSTLYVVLALLIVYGSALRGLGNSMISMFSGFLELAIRLGMSFIFPVILGFNGIAVADILAWVGAGTLLCVYYYKNINNLESFKR